MVVMADPAAGEAFLLALLNSTPVVDGTPTDDLADPAAARAWLTAAAGQGTAAELRRNCGMSGRPGRTFRRSRAASSPRRC